MSDFTTYSQFSQAISSEKITLAILEASKRLVAWTNHSGYIYKKISQDFQAISHLKYNSTQLTQVYSLSAVVAGTFFNDRDNLILYVWNTDNSNPASNFMSVTFKLFYSNAPVNAPYDLSTGFEVYWEPSLKKTSNFGVEIDTIDQQSEAIEGTGTLTLFNDNVFWKANFDKLFFENQDAFIYSWNRQLPITEAKLLFKGKVESKNYSSEAISFRLKDAISILRDAIPSVNISTLYPTYRPLLSQYTSKKRIIYGRVKGFRPVNIDNIIDSRYPLTGTIVATLSSTTITGTGTVFLTELSPDDRLDINDTVYTISTVNSDTSLTLTAAYAAATTGSISIDMLPAGRKRFINRIWCLSGHVLRQAVPTTLVGSTTNLLNLSSTRDIYSGDKLYVGTLGSGTLVTVSSIVNDSLVRLSTSLPIAPVAGTVVTKPCVQDVRINDIELLFYRDYTVNPDTGILTLRDDAEINAGDTKQSLKQATFTNGSRNVTGVSTSFKSSFYPGYMIRPVGTTDWYEILSVTDDTNIILRSAFTGSTETDYIQYKTLIFDNTSILSCEIMGKTVDGLSTGYMLTKGPEIVKDLLVDAGLTDILNTQSFIDTQVLTPETLSFTLPATIDEKKIVTYREVINNINRSIFGILFQNNSFELGYDLLRPNAPSVVTRVEESDCIDIRVDSTNKNMVKSVNVQYDNREYDYRVSNSSFVELSSSSDIAQYIFNTNKQKTIESVLSELADAQRLADRWSFLLEFSSNTITLTTKLLTADLAINDIIDINHRKLFTRFGGTSTRKLVAIQRIVKSGTEVEIEAVDLSNAFNRVAICNTNTTSWVNSSEDIRVVSGFISDDDSMIADDEDSFWSNKIW